MVLVTVIPGVIGDMRLEEEEWSSGSCNRSPMPARIHKTHYISIHQDIILTSIEDLKGLFVKLLDECRTLWGERE